MKKIIVVLVVVVVLVGGFLGYTYWTNSSQKATEPSDPSLALIKAKGKLIVGSDIPYGAMEFYDKSGKAVGFDVDIAQKIAYKLGVQLEFKDYNFDDLFGLVEKGDIDMVVSSITITEERQQKMLFSVPYFNGGQAIVTKVGNTDIKSVESISSKKVGVQIGTTGSEFVKKYVQDKSIVTYQDSASMVGAIKKGDIDLFVVDYIEATSLQKENPSFLKVVGDPLTQEFYGIATKLGNNSLIDATNDVLKNMNRSGEIDQLKQKWFK